MIFCIITTLPPTEEFVNTKIGLLRYPEHRPTEIGGAQDAARAVDRTGGRAKRRGLVDVVEHPRRGRDITDTATTWGITAYLAPAILSTAAATECVSGFYCITLTTVVFS